MRSGAKGLESKLLASDLAATLPNLPCRLNCITLANMASGSITFRLLDSFLEQAKMEISQGARGIVLLQGTDTLEESAFYLALRWKYDIPLLLTGAMKGADSLGADGSANLYAAILCALSKDASGVMIAMNGEIHSAIDASKTHSSALQSFVSPHLGPLARLEENEIRFLRQNPKTPVLWGLGEKGQSGQGQSPNSQSQSPNSQSQAQSQDQARAKVFLHTCSLDEELDFLDFAYENYDALVLQAFGSGHVSEKLFKRLELAVFKPTVICAGVPFGGSTSKTYAYKGSEISLQELGCLMSGKLSAKKTRLLIEAAFFYGHLQNEDKTESLKALLMRFDRAFYL